LVLLKKHLIFCQKIFTVNAAANATPAIICHTRLPNPGSRYADTGGKIKKTTNDTNINIENFFWLINNVHSLTKKN
jgi:hypothetical protein